MIVPIASMRPMTITSRYEVHVKVTGMVGWLHRSSSWAKSNFTLHYQEKKSNTCP